MKIAIYKVNFWATETLQNGKERRTLKTVYMPRFDKETRKHITEAERIVKGTQALLDANYYNIEYGSTVASVMIISL